MRLRTLTPIKLVAVSWAVVTGLLAGSGCKHDKPATTTAATAQPKINPVASTRIVGVKRITTDTTASTQMSMMQSHPIPVAVATATATQPATQADTEPATAPSTAPVTIPAITPATLPAITPATLPAITPATTPATEPTTAATTEPAATTFPFAFNTAAPATTDDEKAADAALADRLAGIAELEFLNKAPDGGYDITFWKHQAALLNACCSLNPTEGRYPRLIADVMVQTHDLDGEEKALQRAVFANPTDERSWNRLIDLRIGKIQTANEKVKDLRRLMAANTGEYALAADVRAHAGLRCAQTLLARGEDDAATSALAEALRDCPSSIECLKLRYEMLPASTPAFERCSQLMDLLRANPMQSKYSIELANLIADNGLTLQSLPWFELAVGTAHRQGIIAQQAMLNWAVALYTNDLTNDALKLNTLLLKLDPKYSPAYILQLVLTRSSDDHDAFIKAKQEAANSLSNRISDAVTAIAPDGYTSPTTRPINDATPVSMPDLSAVVTKINQGVAPELKKNFVDAVSDMILLEGYFSEQPDDAATLIHALQQILPEDSPVLARLQGFNDLLIGKPDDAKTRFSTVATKDPMAQLGLVQLRIKNEEERANAESLARQLLQEHPSGLLGAILWEPLHSDRVRAIPTKQADAIKELLQQFPAEIMSIPEKPKKYYAVEVDPQPVGPHYGDAVLANVTIYNLSNHDLTIGSDGMLKPELLIRISPNLGAKAPFDAFDTLAGPTVLASHMRTSQVVRLDQTQLLAFLNSQPSIDFSLQGVLTTNQTANQVGGYSVQLKREFFRYAAAPQPGNEADALNDLTGDRSEKKITALGLLEVYVQQMRLMKPMPVDGPHEISGMVDAIRRARNDPVPAVSAWASKCEFDLVRAARQAEILKDLTADTDWRHRQLAALLARQADSTVRSDVLKSLQDDKQPSVQAEAQAIQILADVQPTTAPAVDAPVPLAPPAP